MEKLKENKCSVEFRCAGVSCVYFRQEADGDCKHRSQSKCHSPVAQVNAMFLRIKASGIPVEELKRMVEAMG